MYTVLPQALHGGIIVSYRHNFLVLSSPLAVNVVVTTSVQCMCIVHACVHCAYVRLSGFVLAITCIIMHGFQNNLVQFSVIRKSVI